MQRKNHALRVLTALLLAVLLGTLLPVQVFADA